MTENAGIESVDAETVDAGAHGDVVSDPALAGGQGSDWSSEGGATADGPATDVDTGA